jgi:uncharacterized membrane protein
MHIPEALLPPLWYWAAHLLMACLAAWILLTAPWRRLADNAQSHVWLGTCVGLMVLWSIHPGPLRGLDFHLLGATAFTLMFGPQLAILGLSVVIGSRVVMGDLPFEAFSVNALLLAGLPVALSHGILRLVEAALPRNFFIYIFVTAFFGAALVMAASGGIAVGLLAAYGPPPLALLAEQFLPYCLLLAFAEATLTGMIITLLVVYRPRWVGTFDDARYLPGL